MLVIAAVYISVTNKRIKCANTRFAIATIALEWISCISATVVAVSLAVQRYYLAADGMSSLRDRIDEVARYIDSMQQTQTDYLAEPPYAAHACVGTMALVANALVRQAAMCHFIWVRGEKTLLTQCSPENDIRTLSGLQFTRQWREVDWVYLDDTTTALRQVANTLALVLAVHRVWAAPGGIREYLGGASAPQHGTTRFVLLALGVPLGARMVLFCAMGRNRTIQNNSLQVRVFLSVFDSFLSPLLAMWPSLAFLIFHIGAAEAENVAVAAKPFVETTNTSTKKFEPEMDAHQAKETTDNNQTGS
ncbi:hypothetical protein C8Q80DRAFT_1267915 [Daedaleopsis nitida]|nr:hypothetical protein C8Q80DRAFT_1267915 [Daedaleopsis nitida]